MSPQAAQGFIRFLDDLVASGQSQCVKVELGPFVEPLTPDEASQLGSFYAAAVLNEYDALYIRDTDLQTQGCIAWIPSRQVAA